MIAHTNGFKNSITKLGRDINVLIDYYAIVYNLSTEDNKLIITQDNMELLTEEMSSQEPTSQLTNDDIINLNRNNLGELFRTYMKSFDLETTHKFNIGDKMIIRVGTTVNNEIEYLNYGMYYVYEKEYNEDKKTYKYTLCDKMLFTMQKYNNATCFGENTQLTCKQLITNILTEICGFNSNEINLNDALLVNKNENVYSKTFEGLELTCRDVLDMIMQTQGCSLIIEYDSENTKDYIINKTISSNSVETIDDDILKNENIVIGKKYGPLNSLLFSKENGLDNIERKDDTSIYDNGKTQYVIDNNLILEQDNREEFIDNLFSVMNGLEYYVCNINTIGLGYIEYLDRFTINSNNNLYKTICLQNTSNISGGMSESFMSEEILETKKVFDNIGLSDKEASINIDKIKGEIVLKTDSDGKLAQVRLDSSGDEGSLIEIKADQIDLTGKDINLTSDDITISSNNFNVNKYGDVSCSNLTATGGSIALTGPTQSSTKFKITSNSDASKYVELYPGEIRFGNSNTNTIRIIGGQTNSGQIAIGEVGTEYQTNISARSIQTNYINANNIDSGYCTLNSSSETWVDFNKAFDDTPKVVITPFSSTSGVIAVKITGVSQNGFNAIIGGSGYSGIGCSWIAIR